LPLLDVGVAQSEFQQDIFNDESNF